MKTNAKKSLLSAFLMAAICSVCFTANAIPAINSTHNIAVSDTGKMSKMSKPMKKKKMTKMSKDKMKKDTSKMSKM